MTGCSLLNNLNFLQLERYEKPALYIATNIIKTDYAISLRWTFESGTVVLTLQRDLKFKERPYRKRHLSFRFIVWVYNAKAGIAAPISLNS